MNNKRKMNKSDKWKYFLCRSKRDNSFYIFFICLIAIVVLWILYLVKVLSILPLLVAIIGFVICFIFLLIVHGLFILLFMRNAEIVDGHVFKIHRGREYAQNTEASIMATKARAISEDGNISTNWQYYPRKFSKIKDRPVTIVVNKNKGVEFYY